MEQITWYTGLSPTAFFTILAAMIFVFQMVSSMFVSPEEFNKPPTVAISSSNSSNSNLFVNDSGADASLAVQVGRLTEQQLRAYNGSDPNKPLLMAIKGQIYDVSSGRYFFSSFIVRWSVLLFGLWGLFTNLTILNRSSCLVSGVAA